MGGGAVNSESLQQVVLVTGASRGIGAEVARQLARPDTHIIVNYREKAKRAAAVVEGIAAAGGQGSIAGADLSDPQAASAMIGDIAERFGRLDVLVLNASGGLERGADPGYAMRINRDAQLRLVDLAMPLIPSAGASSSSPAIRHTSTASKPSPASYVPVALSKRAGEDALRGMQAVFNERGIGFVVVSGDMIDGTIVVRLLERRDPSAVADRRLHGDLPTVDEFAGGIVAATRDPLICQTIYVGGHDYTRAICCPTDR
jgi:3-oxoacyl-[acyl-carrier protein] reductase